MRKCRTLPGVMETRCLAIWRAGLSLVGAYLQNSKPLKIFLKDACASLLGHNLAALECSHYLYAYYTHSYICFNLSQNRCSWFEPKRLYRLPGKIFAIAPSPSTCDSYYAE